MSTKRPVVLYGANGFSGRLVAEFLREYNVPFIAAGRNRAKIEEVMKHVPGNETADYEIVETAGSVDDLAKLFAGAKVVCNTVGPFLYHGRRVVEASLKAGCHYLDIGGEQGWLREVEENWGAKFAERGLLVAPATAYMSTPSDIAARLCLEHANIDYAGNNHDVQRDTDIWIHADNFCGNSYRGVLPGTESLQAVAARDRSRSRGSGDVAHAIGAGVGRISASGLVQKSPADCECEESWRNF